MNEKEILQLAQQAQDISAKRSEILAKIQPEMVEASDLLIEYTKIMQKINSACCGENPNE